jgi:hypothetical protein
MPGAGLKCRVLQGSTDPKGGWVSPGFGVKRAAPSIRWEGVLRGTTQWRTEIRLHATPAAWSPRAQEETAS